MFEERNQICFIKKIRKKEGMGLKAAFIIFSLVKNKYKTHVSQDLL